ncbi:MAG: hypothetical protein HUK06_02980 [Bacteroidaceae bacterium]|nr:hypothetical protein [Bacteroidaceae bacterium]
MFRFIFSLLFLANITLCYAGDYVPAPYIWTSQSKNSSESMPCGGHDIGMNVWVENGDVLFYASQSGWFDENNTLLKAGRFRLRFSEPFSDDSFSQTLSLDEGCIYIKDKSHAVKIWADTTEPVIYAEIIKGGNNDVCFSFECWRFKDRPLTKDACQQSSWKWNIPKDCMTFADSVIADKDRLAFYHQNRKETVYDFTISKEGLDSVKQQIYNPIGDLRMEGRVYAKGFKFIEATYDIYASTHYKAYNFVAKKVKKATISIELRYGKNNLEFSNPSNINSKKSSEISRRWWHSYWQRSWITTTEPKAAEMVRNYELFRYMLGCNAYGEWPSKFNGGLFTFDPVYEDEKTPFTPDYRRWGGGTMTAQNQRLVYWPMLKSGDFDMMAAQFDTYLRMLPTAILRTKCYWQHRGASFCEQIENFGLPNPAEYGKHKPGEDMGNERNAWLEYQWDTALEFCQMILEAHRYSGLDIKKYEPLIENSLIFFDEHYRYLAKQRGVKDTDSDGHLILYPSSACETYKMAYNPSSVIAALKTVSKSYFGYSKDSAFHKLYLSIPDLPVADNKILPAVVWARIQNVETPQLYPVFPWRMFGAWQKRYDASDDINKLPLEIAQNTYLADEHALNMRSTKGWKQDNIWAACLGLTDEAVRLNTEKFSSGPYRFPAFWDQGFDWSPDLNRGGAAMIGLQEMLLQETPDGEPILLPAWPKEWNVKFKLHSSKGAVEYSN